MDECAEVFLAQHVHTLGGGEEDLKIVGVYSTREKANEAIERLRQQPGFRDAPEGFIVDVYRLDQINWERGYVTLGGSSEGSPTDISGKDAPDVRPES